MDENAPKRSRAHFESGYYCAESVLLAVAEARGVRSELIPKLATGFCSGVARTGNICGALSGAIMAISLSTGRTAPDQSADATYSRINQLIEQFQKKFGATRCRELINCDLGTPEGRQTFKDDNLVEICYGFVEEATRLALTLTEDLEA